jgi:hypothetical protein
MMAMMIIRTMIPTTTVTGIEIRLLSLYGKEAEWHQRSFTYLKQSIETAESYNEHIPVFGSVERVEPSVDALSVLIAPSSEAAARSLDEVGLQDQAWVGLLRVSAGDRAGAWGGARAGGGDSERGADGSALDWKTGKEESDELWGVQMEKAKSERETQREK